jgi:hypothetical protein
MANTCASDHGNSTRLIERSAIIVASIAMDFELRRVLEIDRFGALTAVIA